MIVGAAQALVLGVAVEVARGVAVLVGVEVIRGVTVLVGVAEGRVGVIVGVLVGVVRGGCVAVGVTNGLVDVPPIRDTLATMPSDASIRTRFVGGRSITTALAQVQKPDQAGHACWLESTVYVTPFTRNDWFAVFVLRVKESLPPLGTANSTGICQPIPASPPSGTSYTFVSGIAPENSRLFKW
jgi:hypothetical protein